MSASLKPEDVLRRVSCFGEFDRADKVCLSCCGLNFECAAMHERLHSFEYGSEEITRLDKTYAV